MRMFGQILFAALICLTLLPLSSVGSTLVLRSRVTKNYSL